MRFRSPGGPWAASPSASEERSPLLTTQSEENSRRKAKRCERVGAVYHMPRVSTSLLNPLSTPNSPVLTAPQAARVRRRRSARSLRCTQCGRLEPQAFPLPPSASRIRSRLGVDLLVFMAACHAAWIVVDDLRQLYHFHLLLERLGYGLLCLITRGI